jgi:hypothetical protein
MIWSFRHSVHEVVEAFLPHGVLVGWLDFMLLGELLELAAREGFFQVHSLDLNPR